MDSSPRHTTDLSLSSDTLAQAHQLLLETGQLLSPEMLIIRTRFLSAAFLQALGDGELYLAFLKSMIRHRFDVAFPEEASLYTQYLKDCVRLKNLEQELPGYQVEDYLEDTFHMLETLKTPYYNTYFQTLLSLKSTFTDSEILRAAMKEFYGLMIKSSSRILPMIARIAEQGPVYRDIFPEEQTLIQGLLTANLALCAGRGEDLTLPALEHFLRKEEALYRKNYPKAAPLTELAAGSYTLPELLAERTLLFEERTSPSSDQDTHTVMASQAIDSEFLNHYAYNMNTRSYVTNPAVGREDEIRDLALILISPKKSPILLGQAGVGKTSVVEGLAYALQQGNVPALLKDKRIFKLTTTSLLSGTKYVGEMEERMKKLMDELSQHPEVILFIDEIHTIVGAGSTESSNNDISNMLKPYIDRGDIKLIGATTSEEYQRFIRYDQALSRRFYPILVEEPNEELCLQILEETIPSISHATEVANPFPEDETRRLLAALLSISRPENQPEDLPTHWPELPLSILEMAFSYAALDSRDSLETGDLVRAVSHSNRLKKEVKLQAEQYFALLG